MSLTSKGAALLAFVALGCEVLSSYAWLGLRHQDAAAFLVIFVAAAVMFFLGLRLPKPIKGGSGTLGVPSGRIAQPEPPALQRWQIIEERTVRHTRRVIVGPAAVPGRDVPTIVEAQRKALGE